MSHITRVEKGPTGAVVWHLASGLIILWSGRGGRLQIGSNEPGNSLTLIEHSTADGQYDTFRDADAAVRTFLQQG